MCLLAAIPGVGRFGQKRSYSFGLALMGLGLLLDTGTVLFVRTYWHSPRLVYQMFPQYFLWIFMAGWLVANSKTQMRRATTFLVLAIALCVVVAMHGIVAIDYLYGDSSIYWLLGGCALLLWAPPIPAPRAIGNVVTLLAQSTLFIYLFHWPLAKFLKPVMGSPHRLVRFLLGFLGSVLLWFLWECSLRALKSSAKPAIEMTEPDYVISGD
jgi:peptidoglycan/LPS O-acetylase OafA/YrhL